MLASSKRIRDQHAAAQQAKKAQDLKASADLKENQLRECDLTLMSSINDTVLRESAVDETVLQKRPSNPSMQQQRFSQRPSTTANIFAGKERASQ